MGVQLHDRVAIKSHVVSLLLSHQDLWIFPRQLGAKQQVDAHQFANTFAWLCQPAYQNVLSHQVNVGQHFFQSIVQPDQVQLAMV